MPDVFGLSPARFETFLLIFVRCTFILSLLPVLSSRAIPRLVRIGLSFLISYVVWRTVTPIAPMHGLGELVLAILAQSFVALVFGFVASLVFTGIQFAGEVIDLQIGFGIVNIINPMTQQQVTVIGQFQLAFATLIFLVVDGHHLMLEGLRGSFDLVPLPYVTLSPALVGTVTTFFSQAIAIVLQIAAPVAVALFFTNVSLGLLSRVAPQMNVFVVGFPLQIAIGLVMVVVTIPRVGYVLPHVFNQGPGQLDATLRPMAPVP